MTARSSALTPDFTLEREIGRGGMGVVYRGMDVKLERPVAIKVLPESLADVPGVRERFLREARTAAKLSHQNIVPIYRADDVRGVAFIVMAYVDGESLAERLGKRGALPARELIPILHDVASALDHAHAHGVVHRDVKPENILLDRISGRAHVTDFGIARLAEAKPLTATGQVLGTVHYMSPEQVSGEPVDGRSDLYSLGVVAFRALTGRLPFDNEMASAVLVAHVVKPAPKVAAVMSRAPVALADVIDRALAKKPADRAPQGASLAQLFELEIPDDAPEADPFVAVPDVISSGEAQALWSRAAELQAMTGVQTQIPRPALPLSASEAERRTLTSGYRFADVREAAAEAGIPERYVARAAAELGLAAPAHNGSPAAPLALIDETPGASVWAGAPTSIQYEVTIPGEIPESELYVLVDTIRRRIGESGHIGTLGRSVSWSSSDQHRRLQISIVVRHGTTTIRADERLRQLAGALYGGIVGGGGGGSAGPIIGIGMGAYHSIAAALGIWGAALATAVFVARTVFKRQVRSRQEALRKLVLELADQARDTMRALPRPSS